MQQTAAVLPPEYAAALSTAYEAFATANAQKAPPAKTPGREKEWKAIQKNRAATRKWLVVLIAEARLKGWPFTLISPHMGATNERPDGISPERARQLLPTAANEVSRRGFRQSIPALPHYEKPLTDAQIREAARPRTQRNHLTEAQVTELRKLADLAKRNTGARAIDHKFRVASEEFSRLIIYYRVEFAISWPELSDATGLKQVSLRTRASRHGHGKLPPSIAPYKRVTSKEAAAAHRLQAEPEAS